MNAVIARRFGILPGDMSDLTDLEVDARFELWGRNTDDVLETPESLVAYARAHDRQLELAGFLMASAAALHEELAAIAPKER
jgi:hypothetical protein